MKKFICKKDVFMEDGEKVFTAGQIYCERDSNMTKLSYCVCDDKDDLHWIHGPGHKFFDEHFREDSMNRCVDCKHWIPPRGAALGAIWGSCEHIVHHGDLVEIYTTGYNNWDVVVEMLPNFGCVLWEEK